jgi:hypothetical protein
MNHVRDRTSVRCSLSETEARLESYFASKRAPNGVTRLRLHVPVRAPVSGRPHGLYADREVLVEAWRDRDGVNLNDLMRVTWSPEGSAAFPKFSGTLIVCGDEDPRISHIELDGNYEPPLGAMGEVFDAAIGQRLAESTVREFLEDVRREVERPNRA